MSFFSAVPTGLFLTEFDIMHLSAILFFFIAITASIIFKKQIREAKYEKHFRYAVTILAIAFEIGFKLWNALTQKGTFLTEYLPLDLCAVSLYLCWILSFTKNEKIFRLVYFYSMGALVSLLVPELGGFGVNHFRYYHYFYVHGYIVFTAIYFAAVHQYRIRFRDLLKATGVLVVFASIVMLIDYLLGANYMYLMQRPHASSPLDLFGPWPGYVAALAVITLCVFVAVYLPWIFINRKSKKQLFEKSVS